MTSERLRAYFCAEGKELLQGLSQLMLALERGDAQQDALARMFRSAHTLKGAARVVGQTAIEEMAHIIEDALESHQRTSEPISRQELSELFRLLGTMETELAGFEASLATARHTKTALAEEHLEEIRVSLGDVVELTERAFEVDVQLRALGSALSALGPLERQIDAVLDAQRQLSPQRASPETSQLVPRLERMLADLRDSLERACRQTVQRFEVAQGENSQLRERIDDLRLVPAEAIFPLLERAARDAARSLGRTLRFETSGGSVRLDRHVLSGVRDVLLHAVRNAVDHGIEAPDERVAAGKSQEGRVEVRVERRGSRVAFSCIDDGRGVDIGAVRRAAVARGVVKPQQARALGDDEALRLVFLAGLSTSGEVTELSGRGIGLDIASSIAARLDGELTLASDPASGAHLELVVPVSLSSTTSLVLQSGEDRVVVAFDALVTMLRVRDRELVRTANDCAVVHDGQDVPFVALETLLHSRASPRAPEQAWAVALLRSAAGTVALGADRLLGTIEVATHPLPPGSVAAPWVGGAALDQEGTPLLVLDATRLLGSLATITAARPPPAVPVRGLPVLVVDDSLTTRMLEHDILQAAGYDIDVACSAEEALEKATNRRYGLFIVDVEMPGMNGFEFTEKTRADAQLRAVPVMLVTSLSSEADKQRGAAAGASAFMVKSEFDQRRFLAKVGELLR